MKLKQLRAKDLPKVRKKLLKKQKRKCAICGEKPNRPCVDHEHNKRIKGTGRVRGILCSNCNVFLAKSENNCVRYGIGIRNLPKVLRAMADYLERKHTKMIHPTEAPKPKKLMKSSYNKLKKSYRGNKKFSEFPKSGRLTVALDAMFKECKIKPEFYK